MAENDTDRNSSRKQLNRLAGLSCYAAAVIGVVLTVLAAVEAYQSKRPDYSTLGLFFAGTVNLFGLGYSTSERK